MPKSAKVNNGRRSGKIEAATQIYNPATGNYIKRDSKSGKLTEVKSDGTAFKGLTKEIQIINLGFAIPKSVATKAESAVIKTLNRRIK